MIPRNIILPKVNSIPAAFRYPENETTNSLLDKAQGGIALGDPSKGRTHQLWIAEYENGEIKVRPESSIDHVFTLPAPNAITISLAFDNNMGIVLAWQTASSSHLYHYQTLTASYGTKVISGTTSCKVAIDEPANFYLTKSDVILAYTKNENLYFLVQRERYEIEHLAGPTAGRIIRIGMNEHNRFQFEVGNAVPINTPAPTSSSPPTTTAPPPTFTTTAPPTTTSLVPTSTNTITTSSTAPPSTTQFITAGFPVKLGPNTAQMVQNGEVFNAFLKFNTITKLLEYGFSGSFVSYKKSEYDISSGPDNYRGFVSFRSNLDVEILLTNSENRTKTASLIMLPYHFTVQTTLTEEQFRNIKTCLYDRIPYTVPPAP